MRESKQIDKETGISPRQKLLGVIARKTAGRARSINHGLGKTRPSIDLEYLVLYQDNF